MQPRPSFAKSALTLIVPDKVVSNTNNSATYRPYDSTHAIGDLSPTTAQPPKGNKCGTFGLILIAVIAIAVAAIVAPALIGSATTIGGFMAGATYVPAITFGATGLTAAIGATGAAIVGGAVAAAAGSAISQLVGTRLGIQDKLSWKGVALAALSGGVAGGLNASGLFGQTLGAKFYSGTLGIKSGTVDATLRAMTSSALSQGIGSKLGLQDKINWAGVAGAGVAATISPIRATNPDGSINQIATSAITGMARNVANAATRSLIEGSDFGDNIVSALPDTIAQTIVDLVGSAVKGGKENSGRKNRSGSNQAASLSSDPNETVSQLAQQARFADDELEFQLRVRLSRAVENVERMGRSKFKTAKTDANAQRQIATNAIELVAAKRGNITISQQWDTSTLIFDQRGVWARPVGPSEVQQLISMRDHGTRIKDIPGDALIVTQTRSGPRTLHFTSAVLSDGGVVHTISDDAGNIAAYSGTEPQDFPELGIRVGYGPMPKLAYPEAHLANSSWMALPEDVRWAYGKAWADRDANRTLGSFVLASLAGAGTATLGVATIGALELSGASEITVGGLFAGLSSGNAGATYRHVWGEENTLTTYGKDFLLGVVLYGGGRAFHAYGEGWRPTNPLGGKPTSRAPEGPITGTPNLVVSEQPGGTLAAEGTSVLARLRSTNTTLLSTAEKGALGEARAALTRVRAGYQSLDARLPSNNGFDGVWIKYGADGNPVDIIISESKFSSTGRASLSTTNMGKQMDSDWIAANLRKMQTSPDPAVRKTFRILQENRDIVRLKANVLDPNGVNSWNKIKVGD